MTSTGVQSAGIDLTDTYGAVLVGVFISCFIWGVSCIQTIFYFHTYENDKQSTKLIIAFLWAVDTANEILLLKAIWPTLIQQWGNPAILTVVSPELTHEGWTSGIVAAMVQTFFIHRVWKFGGKTWLPFVAFLMLITVYQLAAVFPYVVIALNGTLETLSDNTEYALTVSIRSCTMADDVLITLALFYFLLRGGISRFSQSRQRLYRLLVVTFNSGAWTALFALLNIALFVAYPTKLIYCIFEFPLSSLYFSTLLANLNTRDLVRGKPTAPNTYLVSNIEMVPPSRGGNSQSTQATAFNIGRFTSSKTQDSSTGTVTNTFDYGPGDVHQVAFTPTSSGKEKASELAVV